MFISIIRLLVTFLFIQLAPLLLSAQVRVVVQDLKCFSDSQSECQNIRSDVMNTLRSDDRLQLMGSSDKEALQSEIELQKNEDFLEGYVVDAWYSSETDWLLTYHYSSRTKTFIARIFDAKTQTLIDEEQIIIQLGLLGTIQGRQEKLIQSIQRLIARQFPSPIPIIKTLNSSKTKVREILIAGGTNQGIYTGQKLIIKATTATPSLTETPVLAELEVWMVESENFSRCFVTDGGKALFEALAEGQSLQVLIP
jgi:hypothetical protein